MTADISYRDPVDRSALNNPEKPRPCSGRTPMAFTYQVAFLIERLTFTYGNDFGNPRDSVAINTKRFVIRALVERAIV